MCSRLYDTPNAPMCGGVYLDYAEVESDSKLTPFRVALYRVIFMDGLILRGGLIFRMGLYYRVSLYLGCSGWANIWVGLYSGWAYI